MFLIYLNSKHRKMSNSETHSTSPSAEVIVLDSDDEDDGKILSVPIDDVEEISSSDDEEMESSSENGK